MDPVYLREGLSIGAGRANDPAMVRALQRDLRALGYLPGGVDGNFGTQTAKAIRALQNDLLGKVKPGSDGPAAMDFTTFNDDGEGNKLVGQINGVMDQGLAQALAAMMAHEDLALLPEADDPKAENAKALEAIQMVSSGVAPTPFIIAIVRQESDARHFNEPSKGNDDRFVTIGLDRNDPANPDHITSRGYGIGQYTFFHHPLSKDELAGYVSDCVLNVKNSYVELRGKFDKFIVGPSSKADDRTAEHPHLPLRLCKYQPTDPLYMRDCKNCALGARKIDIAPGMPFYNGSSAGYETSQYYKSANYMGVPDRADFLCDWPYAVRRYNGAGVNSFHYQMRVVLNLLR